MEWWGFVLISLAVSAASMVVQSLLVRRPPSQATNPAGLEEFEFPQMDEGTPQAVVFGDVWIKDWFVLWYGNYRTEAISREGGK